MKLQKRYGAIFLSMIATIVLSSMAYCDSIPLPEHPRPDFVRPQWINLNGVWKFEFDAKDRGIIEEWFNKTAYTKEITVPFPWGSKLSGLEDEADIGWYTRKICVPESWKNNRVFLILSACDWHKTIWLDGVKIGEHQGGYLPSEFELTSHIKVGQDHQLVVRADDVRRQFTLYGKQGYGNARGIWQTPYLEARGTAALRKVHFYPDIDNEKVVVKARLLEAAPDDLSLKIDFKLDGIAESTQSIKKGAQEVAFEIPIANPRLWTLDDPFLYEVSVSVEGDSLAKDTVEAYFGMRKISVVNLPGTEFPYIALNNKPIYLQLTLDQAYHPDGYYTFPSDEFMRDEILRSKSIGLNGMRVHVKVPIPRKLYWADKLGMLIMEDLPNSWGAPDVDMRREVETSLPQMIERDFNHPSVFSWVIFNETWGLKTGKQYLPETQEWVVSMLKKAKSLDPTRLVEDNSPCLNDHTVTDINTWHAYRAGYEWKGLLDDFCAKTYEGSEWNYAKGYKQNKEPMLNSECGNVWGYDGSSGDVDFSWDYHQMMDQFRRHPQCSGWLYTEHHDVINEWNGYWRFDRSEKFTGFDELVPGMSLRDLHSPVYVALADALCSTVKAGERISVPAYLSIFTDSFEPQDFTLEWELVGWDEFGGVHELENASRKIAAAPWMNRELDPITVTMPELEFLTVLRTCLKDNAGRVLHRNFTSFLVESGKEYWHKIAIDPKSFSDAKWSLKQWNVLDGLKVNGAGSGYFEYKIPWPEKINLDDYASASLRFEASAKQLFGKDRDDQKKGNSNYMTGGGLHDPSQNKNSYPMTDEYTTPSMVKVQVAAQSVGSFYLNDDPADHRGILSWNSQKRDKKLREAGSYGYLINASIPKDVLQKAYKNKEIVIRLEVSESLAGGLAIYGKRFGRYPLDPTLVFNKK